jgi:hypothetical protein
MKHLFRFVLVSALLTFGVGVTPAAQNPPVVVTAFMSNAGPYGESCMHKPALQLDVRLGSTHHNVNVYDPKQLEKDAAVERFRKVWNAVFATIPIKPAW